MIPQPLVEATNLSKEFPLPRGLSAWVAGRPKRAIHAVERVSFTINPGETLGLIGESGSGKTTLGALVARLDEPTSGELRFAGVEIGRLKGKALLRFRQRVQVVFQDPVGSLDPRLRVWQIVGEPIRAQGRFSRARVRAAVADVLPTVGLPTDCLDQYPHEFSGGGRQRIGLARALSVHPSLVVLDEPTSALDVAVQAQIRNRLVPLQRELGLAYLLITHNVGAVRFVADRVAVQYVGRLAEVGNVRDVLEHPAHPYTKALLAALPDPKRRGGEYRVTGEVPSLIDVPPGCRFAPRCPFVIAKCRIEEPELVPLAPGSTQLVACHRATEVAALPPETLIDPVPAAPLAAAAS